MWRPPSHLLGALDEQLLCEGHSVQTQLHTQITTGHHQGLGLGDDALNVGEGLGTLVLHAVLHGAT